MRMASDIVNKPKKKSDIAFAAPINWIQPKPFECIVLSQKLKQCNKILTSIDIHYIV